MVKDHPEVHHGFHSDSRSTVVLINGKIYELTPSEWTKQTLRDAFPKDRPHVRILNPIIVRTEFQQELKNKDDQFLHELFQQIPKENYGKAIKADIKAGVVNADDEVQKLLDLKEKAQKAGDGKECRRIRQLLRKLDYKRSKQTKEK
jgi:hypothetical protein